MKIKKYTTDIRNRVYFKESNINLKEYRDEEWNIINIHPEISYQEWKGLGGALTNSSITCLNKLNDDKKELLLEEYFKGLKYNIIRVPLGSTDFSKKSEEDYKADFSNNVELINIIKKIRNIKILLTPWSPPKKFKTNNSLYGGSLRKDSYNDYANYIAECINEYNSKDIKINYLSVQNEPMAKQRWESCKFEIEDLKEFTYKYLIPKLKDTGIILWDHNKENLYNNFKKLYENNSKIKGLGFHWYSGAFLEEMKLIRDSYPQILLIETEMCCGFSRYRKNRWIKDAENYLTEIIGGINNGLNMFIDWNMILSFYGGPNHKLNNCKSPIILNRWKNNYIKTPIYYYLKHIGICDNAKVISTSSYDRNGDIQVTALKNEKTYLIVLNKSKKNKHINIKIGNKVIKDCINKHSIITYEI